MKTIQIKSAEYLDGYRVHLQFSNGEQGIADLKDLIERYDAAKSLRDTSEFAQFRLDEWPTMVWDCGFDLSPETLYERATGKKIGWVLQAVA